MYKVLENIWNNNPEVQAITSLPLEETKEGFALSTTTNQNDFDSDVLFESVETPGYISGEIQYIESYDQDNIVLSLIDFDTNYELFKLDISEEQPKNISLGMFNGQGKKL